MSALRRARRGLAVAPLLLACAGAPPPAWELPAPKPRDAAITRPDAVSRGALANGLETLLLEDRRLPRVSVGLALRRGAAVEPREQAGLAAFTAELMERGAGERGALELAEAVEEIGARLSVYADWDSVGVYVSGLSRDLDRLLEILADVALRPRFEPGEAERVRGETIAAQQRALDDPGTLASWHTNRVLYPDHRYGLPLGGTPESVAGLEADAARAFHGALFVPSNAIFSASGDFDADEIERRVEELFGAWEGGAAPPIGVPPANPTPASRQIRIVDRPDLEQSRIVVAHEGISRTDPERISAQLMNSVLGGSGFSSRLMQSVRTDAGLTYGVRSGFSLRRAAGPFRVSTFTEVPQTRRVIDLLLAELEGIREQPPSERELRDAQMLAVGEFALGLETSSAVTGSLVNLDIYGLPRDSLDTYRARVRDVTTQDTTLAAGLVHPKRAAIVLVGPAELLRPQVEDLGPVEVVAP